METKPDYCKLEFDSSSSILFTSIDRIPGGVRWSKEFEAMQLDFIKSVTRKKAFFYLILDASPLSKISFDLLLYNLLNSMRAMQKAGLRFEAIVKPKGVDFFRLISEVGDDLDQYPIGIFESRVEAIDFITRETSTLTPRE